MLLSKDKDKILERILSVNNRIFNDTLEIDKPSMILLNLRDILSEEELEDTISVDCRYFDIDNKELRVE